METPLKTNVSGTSFQHPCPCENNCGNKRYKPKSTTRLPCCGIVQRKPELQHIIGNPCSKMWTNSHETGMASPQQSAELRLRHSSSRSGIGLVASGLLPTLGIHHHNRYNAYCLADDIMEPYRPYVDELVFRVFASHGTEVTLPKDVKAQLPAIQHIDFTIAHKRIPLMVAVSQTTASLCKCFSGKLRKIVYPEKEA